MPEPAPSPPLTVQCGDAVYALTPDRAAIVGHGGPADVPVEDPRVSPAHVRLEPHLGRWRAIDTSRTGMFVDGERRAVVDIGDGSTIRLGHPDGTAVTFRLAADELGGDSFEQHFDPGVARAGAAVSARRRELQITQRTLAKYRIMNAGALIAFEKGRSWPRERTRAKLEEVLHWPAGTIANIRNGGAVPGDQPEVVPENDQVQLIVDAVEVAMNTFTAAIGALPDVSDPAFADRATVVLADMRQLEAVVARAARQSRGIPAVIMALSTVRNAYGDYVLTAGAVAPDGQPLPNSIAGPWVGVAAPGLEIMGLSSVNGAPVNALPAREPGKATPFWGTSFAAAYSSGVAALVRAKYPQLSAHQVIRRITETAHNPPRGVDNVVGYGVIDPVAALTFDVPPGDRQPPERLTTFMTMPPPVPAPDLRPRHTALIGAAAVMAVVGIVAAAAGLRRRTP